MTLIRRHAAAAVTATALLALTGCSEVGDVVESAQTQVEEAAETAEFCVAAVRLADAVQARDVDAAVAAGEDFVDTAPDEIRGDTELVLDAAREAQDGDPSALATEEVQAAGERIRAFTVDECNPAADDA